MGRRYNIYNLLAYYGSSENVVYFLGKEAATGARVVLAGLLVWYSSLRGGKVGRGGMMAGEAAAKVEVVGVIGAGQMGSGIAQLAAVAGIDVWLQDTDQAALDRAGAAISDSIRRLASKGQIPQVSDPENEPRDLHLFRASSFSSIFSLLLFSFFFLELIAF